MQDIEQRVPVMDAQYKIITKTAQLISKESSQEEANEMFATMSGLKEQITKVGHPVRTNIAFCGPIPPHHMGKLFSC